MIGKNRKYAEKYDEIEDNHHKYGTEKCSVQYPWVTSKATVCKEIDNWDYLETAQIVKHYVYGGHRKPAQAKVIWNLGPHEKYNVLQIIQYTNTV